MNVLNHKNNILAGLLLSIALSSNALADLVGADLRALKMQGSITATADSVPNGRAQWFTYQVAMEASNGMPCCLIADSESSCSLDKRSNSWSSSMDGQGDSKILEIYFKMDNQVPADIFLAGRECKVDGEDNLVYVIEGVSAKQSISFLSGLVRSDDQVKLNKDLANRALAAIALHHGSDAHSMLENLASSGKSGVGHTAIFWLGETRNKAGYDSLLNIVDDSARGIEARTQAIFALSVNSYEKSSDKLVKLAKTSSHETIQAEAIFWLAQNHESKAGKVIDYVLTHSNSAQVKRKAVFSLSLLKTQASWQQLIELAQSGGDRQVQEEAIFWLSQNENRNPVSILVALANGENPNSIKRKAVFALSRLGSEQATPALMELIGGSPHKLVKKEALFWLGQSDDPAAFAYLERVLTSSAN